MFMREEKEFFNRRWTQINADGRGDKEVEVA
jgi:hypothetical protein